MKNPSNNSKTQSSHDGTSGLLTGADGMGGLRGGGGHDFQYRYIVCHILEWLKEPGFTQIFPEGTGDVDIAYSNATPPWAEHIQVKGNDVNLGDFRAVLKAFQAYDTTKPGVYQRFTLACPSTHAKVKALCEGLERIRNAQGFQGFALVPDALSGEMADLDKRISDLRVVDYADLIKEKLHFHIGIHNFHDDNSCSEIFGGKLLSHPEYREKFAPGAAAAYKDLMGSVRNGAGRAINRKELIDILEAAAHGTSSVEPSHNLVIHNYTVEATDLEAPRVLDWSEHFDRDTRHVPLSATWNQELLPQLRTLKKAWLQEPPRLIRFRGRCALSTGIMLGATFPQVGGWTLEVPQPQPPRFWRTSAPIQAAYPLQVRHLGGEDEFLLDAGSDAIALIVSVTHDSIPNVRKYLQASSTSIAAVVAVTPAHGIGKEAISGTDEANSIASKTREVLETVRTENGAVITHLFFNGPFGLAVMVGHRLSSAGRIQLYEWQEPGFLPSVTFLT